jgi:hypothetical protein
MDSYSLVLFSTNTFKNRALLLEIFVNKGFNMADQKQRIFWSKTSLSKAKFNPLILLPLRKESKHFVRISLSITNEQFAQNKIDICLPSNQELSSFFFNTNKVVTKVTYILLANQKEEMSHVTWSSQSCIMSINNCVK